MKLLRWNQQSLSFKLSITITLLIAVSVSIVSFLAAEREQQGFVKELETEALVVLVTLETAIANPLIGLDIDSLQTTLEALADSQTNIHAQIFDPTGRAIADSRVEGGLTFNFDIDPYGEQLIAQDDITYEWSDDQLIAGKAVVIGRQVLGAISIDLPTTSLILKTQEATNQGIGIAAIIGLIGTLIAIVISRTITTPLRDLNEAARQGAQGEYTPVDHISSGDEVGELAVSFNQMIKAIQHRTQLLQDATEEAHEASRLKSEFLSTMSHELRTPLNAIEGFTSIMLGGMGIELEPRAEEMVKRVSANSKRLLHLINDFLDLARIESGRLDLIKEPISPANLAQKWKSEVGILAEEKDVEFIVKVSSELPPMILGDEDSLSKMGINLLSNAIKFTHQGQVSLEMSKVNDKWTISVSDTGIGIPPHAREYIFDEFRQVDSTSKREYGGTGLGLSLVQKLSRIMGGNVSLESEVGKGSKFTIMLPLETYVGNGVTDE